jgi:hypothetical protein
MMKRLEEFEEELRSRWANDPACALCVKLIRYMSEQPDERLRMMTFFTICSILDRAPLDEEVCRAITILVSSRVHALDTYLLFIDQENNEYELSQQELEEVQKVVFLFILRLVKW